MATLHITEFELIPTAPDGETLWLSNLSQVIAHQIVTFTTSVQSNAFDARTSFIRVSSDQKAHLKVDPDPTATNQHTPIAPNSPEHFGVKPGDKIAAYDGTS